MSMDKPLETLSRVTGLPRDRIMEAFKEAKANYKALAECPMHAFVEIEGKPSSSLDVKYRCSVCGGTITGREFRWYERGLEDGRKESE